MAAGDPFYSCEQAGIDLKDLLNSLLTKETATGDFGLRVYVSEVNANTLEDGMGCEEPQNSIEAIIRKVIVIDSEGKPALRLFDVLT